MMQSFQIDDDQKETWRTKGFLLIPALLPEVLLTELKWEIYALYLARFEMPQDEVELGLRVILDRYESHKTEWRQCANRLGSLPALARIAGAPELLALAKQLDLSYPIFSTSPELRIDMPGDDQYRQPWHQDWRSGQSSFNAITMWFPLHSIDADLGPLSIVPGSHQHGLLASEELTNPRRFRISDTRFICDGQLEVELGLGDCLVFSQLTAHRSGKNISNRPRFSVQIRFADLDDPQFREKGYAIPTSSTLLSDRVPEAVDMTALTGTDAR